MPSPIERMIDEAIETEPPHQRRLYMDGNQWCAVGPWFRNLAIDHAGFGNTQSDAVANLNATRRENLVVKDFEVGGFCRQCKDWVAEKQIMDGCRDPDCPCQ